VSCSGRHDEIVKRHGLDAAAEPDDSPLDVDGLRVGHQDGRVPLLSQYPPDRRTDVAWRKRGRGDLVEERLEDEVIGPVDHGHVDGRCAQRLRRCNSAKPTAKYHDPLPHHGQLIIGIS
jgi:hypothetical protein